MAYPLSTAKVSREPGAIQGGSASSGSVRRPKSGGGFLRNLLTLIFIIIILAGGIYFVAGYSSLKSLLPGGGLFKSEWQAVFLSNGQVYFGKVEKVHPDFVFLADIYYLQLVSNNTDTSALGQPPDVQAQPEQRLTLIKLGNEIHGPTDSMLINREHVVIIEDLKNDSRVVQAINDYIAKGRTQQ